MALFLVDSSIFVFRAWFGQAKHFNKNEEPNQAFIGFSDFIYQLLRDRNPACLVCAFDQSQKQSERKEIYPEYKANRSVAPAELKNQFAICRQWLGHLAISDVSSDSWEADDLIGTLALLHRSDQSTITILSADKDLAQLIRPGDLWWPYPLDALDYRAVTKKFKLPPEQIAEQLALAGDKVDNIPGIPQVGMRTASNLLKKFGSIENLRKNLDQVSKMKFRFASQVQQSLIENEHLLELSSRLTKINCEVDAMDAVLVDRGKINALELDAMMIDQCMDNSRQQKWQELINSRAFSQYRA
ncbi:MAG: DNA polymerase-1 [Gammaproteobacteria bacterium]|jgi:DNA polymerase-1